VVEWLKKFLRRPALSAVALLAIGSSIPWATLGVVALVSDIGFSEEVKNYRWWIILASLALGVLADVIYVFWYCRYRLGVQRSEIDRLTRENQDLNEQKESVFRLMKRYEAEAKEDIFKRLQDLVISNLFQQEWKDKGARVERFRVEQSVAGNEDLHINDSPDRVTIFINLSMNDALSVGMRFLVQDPTDHKTYGTIVVNECHEEGSTCSIVETAHPAFWAEVTEAMKSPSASPIIIAKPNIIVPNNPYKALNEDNAEQLLQWLETLKPVQL
jgi:hypothetical protein